MATIEKEQILKELLEIKDLRERFAYLIQKGKSHAEFSDDEKIEKNIIKGCNSQLWLIPELVEGKVNFRVDSDAAIPKGIAAVLAEAYSGLTPQEILVTEPDFLKEAGIEQHLSMNRRNGLSNICKQIKLYAMAFQALAATQ